MFIQSAFAAAAQPAGAADQFMSIFPLVFIFVLFYFMLLRPQMKRAKDQRAMMAALQKGDEVVTATGILGKVSKVTDAYVSLEVADNVVINVQKQAIQSLLPKGTIKGLS